MRVLNTVCGVAVLLNALHMGHAVHYFLTIAAQESMHGVEMWAGGMTETRARAALLA